MAIGSLHLQHSRGAISLELGGVYFLFSNPGISEKGRDIKTNIEVLDHFRAHFKELFFWGGGGFEEQS